jgi:hypothetical protein
MKKVLLLTLAALMISSVALADNVSMYSDISGTSCLISAAGFNSTAAVVHKFSLGATYSRFKVTLPAGSVAVRFHDLQRVPRHRRVDLGHFGRLRRLLDGFLVRRHDPRAA